MTKQKVYGVKNIFYFFSQHLPPPSEIIVKLFKVCTLSGNLDGSEDDQLMCIKYGPCQGLLPRLQSIQEENVDPFVEIPEEERLLEDIAGLQVEFDCEDNELEVIKV